MVDIDGVRELLGVEKTALEKVQEVFPGAEEIELKPRKITWKGKTTIVYDYELFVMMIKDWIKRDNITKEQALDLFFEMQ